MKEVLLSGKRAAGRVARVDDGDYGLVTQYRWWAREWHRKNGAVSGPYAANGDLLMHCLILGVKGVDHIDHNTLNNQRFNLRPATQSQNGGNASKRSGSTTSRYKGVYWDRAGRVWIAGASANRRSVHLGRFASEVDAALAYDAGARELFGEFAALNFPGHGENSALASIPEAGDVAGLQPSLFGGAVA
jgi:hypothetical protein